jgi:predicted nucleic acid-binding protein
VKVFCDTNIVIAACLGGHSHHEQARPVLERIKAGKDTGFVAAHTLAEAYAVLTRLPDADRVAPTVAWQLISENVVNNFSVITLTAREYSETLASAAASGIEGGRTYDALLLAAAMKSGAERIFTLNVRHFQSLADERIRSRIASP